LKHLYALIEKIKELPLEPESKKEEEKKE